MSVAEIERLLHDYHAWLRDKTTLRQVNGEWVEITTPYLDRHNDALQLYVRAESGGYILTDDTTMTLRLRGATSIRRSGRISLE